MWDPDPGLPECPNFSVEAQNSSFSGLLIFEDCCKILPTAESNSLAASGQPPCFQTCKEQLWRETGLRAGTLVLDSSPTLPVPHKLGQILKVALSCRFTLF